MPVKNKTKWTKDLMRVYQRFPSVIRSKYWPDVIKAANSGHVDAAIAIAQDHEGSHKSVRAANVIARRIRIQRVALFALQKQSEVRIRAIFQTTSANIRAIALTAKKGLGSIPRSRKKMHEEVMLLRVELKKEITNIIWQSLVLGIKNMGEAIKPVIRQNQESFAEEIADVQLLEERLTLGVTHHISGKADRTQTDLGSDKWNNILDQLYANIVAKNNEGLTPSQRIWDLTNTMDNNLRKTLITEIAAGTSPSEIADQLQKYVYTDGVDENIDTGPGIYKDPFANAMRLARTETSRAYADATGAWAQNKSWIEGIQPTLSPAHDQADECDDYAEGDPLDPSEFADTFPLHPHCMCYGTYVIKDDYLTGDGETDNSDQSDNSGDGSTEGE